MEIKTFKEWDRKIEIDIENSIDEAKDFQEFFTEDDKKAIIHHHECVKLVDVNDLKCWIRQNSFSRNELMAKLSQTPTKKSKEE